MTRTVTIIVPVWHKMALDTSLQLRTPRRRAGTRWCTNSSVLADVGSIHCGHTAMRSKDARHLDVRTEQKLNCLPKCPVSKPNCFCLVESAPKTLENHCGFFLPSYHFSQVLRQQLSVPKSQELVLSMRCFDMKRWCHWRCLSGLDVGWMSWERNSCHFFFQGQTGPTKQALIWFGKGHFQNHVI